MLSHRVFSPKLRLVLIVACLGYAAFTAQHDPQRAAVLVLVVAMLGYGAVRLGGVPSAFAALRRNDLASAKRLLDQWEIEKQNFWQVCPKEMLNRLKHPLSDRPAAAIA